MKYKSILDFYYMAYDAVICSGYANEIDYIDSLKPIEEQDTHTFFLEYVWVVLNAGMKEQVARNIYNRYCENFDIIFIRHPTKKKAIKHMFDNYIPTFEGLLNADDKINHLETLPWIGPITKYHLARNIGIDTVKPDRHLVRLAKMFGFDTPMKMCEHIQKDNGTKLGTIDVVLWRYCNLYPDYQR
jgi:hypothetical protein